MEHNTNQKDKIFLQTGNLSLAAELERLNDREDTFKNKVDKMVKATPRSTEKSIHLKL